MKSEYYYYLKVIKPIEKKYTRMCILYQIFKINYFKNKRDIYNKILIIYYNMLQHNSYNLDIIKKNLDN